MLYRIVHHRLFEKEILKLPTHHQEKVYRLLISFKQNPKKLPANTTPLQSYNNIYRTRIGDFRLIYKISRGEKTIFVLGVGSRGNVYKLLRRMLG